MSQCSWIISTSLRCRMMCIAILDLFLKELFVFFEELSVFLEKILPIMDPLFPTMPVELIHPSGLVFKLNLTQQEVDKFRSDQAYANQVLEKYYSLYQSGLLNSNTEEEIEIQETHCNIQTQLTESTLTERTHLNPEDEELLIQLVSEKPPLYDFRLPLKERSREIVRKLWEEIREQLNVDITMEQLMKKWKNIRDSFMRVRSNIKKKIASGSSAKDKLMAEKLQKNHKHYDQLMFLEDTLNSRRTSSNLDDIFFDEDSRASSKLAETATSRCSSKMSNVEHELGAQDKAFIEAVKTLSGPKDLTPTQNPAFG